MDIVSIVNLLSNVPTDKIVSLFCLVIVSVGGFWVLKNNTSAINGLTDTLKIIVTNQQLHEERNKSDFKSVNIALDNNDKHISRVEQDVVSVREDVNDVKAHMATKDDLQDVSKTVSMIQGKIDK